MLCCGELIEQHGASARRQNELGDHSQRDRRIAQVRYRLRARRVGQHDEWPQWRRLGQRAQSGIDGPGPVASPRLAHLCRVLPPVPTRPVLCDIILMIGQIAKPHSQSDRVIINEPSDAHKVAELCTIAAFGERVIDLRP